MGALFTNDAAAPPWATDFGPGGYRLFLTCVKEALRAQKQDFLFEPECVTIENNGEKCVLWLRNIAKTCARTEVGEWPAIVDKYVTALMTQANWRPQAEGLEAVSDLLSVRLCSGPPRGAQQVVERELADGLQARLVVDLPDVIRSVSPRDLDSWSLGRDQAFDLALSNLRSEGLIEREGISFEAPGSQLYALGGRDLAASHLLFLEEYLVAPGEFGALVACPQRGMLLFHEIHSLALLDVLYRLMPIVKSLFEDGPGSITPNLYWWKDGRLELLPATTDDQSVEFHPSDEFLDEVLSRLGEVN